MARDTSFYYAFLMLPPAQRNAIVAVWDFCRAVDDAVDNAVDDDPVDGDRVDGAGGEGAMPPRDAIAFWRAELAR